MSQVRRVLRRVARRAVRTVVESLEDRRLLAAATIGTPSFAGTGPYVPVTLTGPGAPTLSPGHFVLQNLADPDSDETFATDVSAAGNVSTFRLDRPASGPQEPTEPSDGDSPTPEPMPAERLADGWYDAYVRHPQLNPDEAHANFCFLNADFDNDGGVSINDYNVLAANFGKTHHANGTPMTFAEGDADYDGGVSIDDYNLLAARFGKTLPLVPTQAGGVAVTNINDGKLDVIWAAAAGETRDGFKIYRSDDGGQTFRMVHTEADPAAHTWQDGNVPNDPLTIGEKYWYRVRSYTNAHGANASATKAWGIPAVTPPVPSDLWAQGIGDRSIWVEWAPATNKPVANYRLYRSTTPSNHLADYGNPIATLDPSLTQYTDTDRDIGTTYYYTLVAVGTDGQVSLPLPPVQATVENQAPVITGGDDVTTTTTTARIGVTATDDDYPAGLSYAWSALPGPDGATSSLATPTASSTDVTFHQAGYYEFNVDVGDGDLTSSYTVGVDVQQNAGSLSIGPESVSLNVGQTHQFVASATDQFGHDIDHVNVTWDAEGPITTGGSYTAPGQQEDTITAHVAGSSLEATADVTITLPAPSGVTARAINDREANVTWTDGGEGVTGYVIEKWDAASQSYVGIQTAPVNATGWSLSGLSPDTTYSLRVTALAGDLRSPSTDVSVRTPAGGAPVVEWDPENYGNLRDDSLSGTATISDLTSGMPYRITITFQPTGAWDGNNSSNPASDVPVGPDSFSVKFDGREVLGGTQITTGNADYYDETDEDHSDMADYVGNVPPYTEIFTANPDGRHTVQVNVNVADDVEQDNEGWWASVAVTPLLPSVNIAPAEAGDEEAWETQLGDTKPLDNKVRFKVSRTGNADDGDFDAPLTVRFHPPAGTAVTPADYSGYASTATIPAGAASTVVTLTALDDGEPEPTEQLEWCIAADAHYRLGGYTAAGTINDVGVDLAIDSNNDGSTDTTPNGSDDGIEADPAKPGKYADIDNYDTDGDFIPGLADGFYLAGRDPNHNAAVGLQFVPIQVTIPADADIDAGKLTFTYLMDDPTQVFIPANESTAETYQYHTQIGSNGELRLWTKQGDVFRYPQDASSTTSGDFVRSGKAFTLEELGFTASKRTVELYAEAVDRSFPSYDSVQPITVSYAATPTAAATSDTVNVTCVYNPDDWRAVARKEAGFRLRRWQPQNAYTSDNRTELKHIYSYYEKLYTDDYVAHGNGATLGKFQWMGLAKVAGRKVVEGLDLMGLAGGINAAHIYLATVAQAASVLPDWVLATHPELQAMIALGNLTGPPLANLQSHILETQETLLEMAYAIFNDAAWQHVAYRDAGIDEIHRLGDKADLQIPGPTQLQANPSLIVNVVGAWEMIDKGRQRHLAWQRAVDQPRAERHALAGLAEDRQSEHVRRRAVRTVDRQEIVRRDIRLKDWRRSLLWRAEFLEFLQSAQCSHRRRGLVDRRTPGQHQAVYLHQKLVVDVAIQHAAPRPAVEVPECAASSPVATETLSQRIC